MKKSKGKKQRYKELSYLSKELKEEIKKPKPRTRALEKLFNELYVYATRDHLTGVFNRRVLDELLSKEISKSIRHNLPLSLVILDVDDFKNYNDKYGHLQGDMALRTITKVVSKMTRKEDFVARYGGEEFIIVLPDTKLEKAKEVAEKIRKAIAETKIKLINKSIEKSAEKLTVSMGIAQLNKRDVQNMLARADTALYKAKAKGKNQVCVIE